MLECYEDDWAMVPDEVEMVVRPTIMGRFRQRLMGLSLREADFEVRGFEGGVFREGLERIGRGFIAGFNATLGARSIAGVCDGLSRLPADLRGFAHEGAGMSAALLDRLWPPWAPRRVPMLLEQAPQHTHLIHVGVGWALARLRRRSPVPPRELDPLLGWLAFDGYGFHEGYFDWVRWFGPAARHHRAPFDGIPARIFDQGLGRSMWFSQGSDVSAIARLIATFEPSRAEDLWSGIGLACTYAGGADAEALGYLREAAGQQSAFVGQGACFAATARARAGEVPSHTRVATEVLCGLSVEDATVLCDETLPTGPECCTGADYQGWRAAIRTRLSTRMG